MPLVGRGLLPARPTEAREGRVVETTLGGVRAGTAVVVSAGSFFVLSNGAFWAQTHMYPHTGAGLAACYAAGVPFLRNDLLSTAVTVGALLGLPALIRGLALRATRTRPA